MDKELTRIVNKDTSILSTPNFVSSDFWIASSSLFKKQKGKTSILYNSSKKIIQHKNAVHFFFFTTKTLENQFVLLILPEEAEIKLHPT